PPLSPVLHEYGEGFVDVIARTDAAERLPFLPQLAEADRAWLRPYHAADAQVLSPADRGAVDPDRLHDSVLEPHPATRLIDSRFPLHAIWTAARDGRMPDRAKGPQSILITRPYDEVRTRALDP